jgi:adenylate cyclase
MSSFLSRARLLLSALLTAIALPAGVAVVGEMGTEERTKYGMIGDAVNVASRLEAASKRFDTTTLVSRETRDQAGAAFLFREIDAIRVVGRAAPLRIFEPLGTTDAALPERIAAHDRYEAALVAYRARDFARAIALLAAQGPADGATRSLLERARRYCDSLPPADWDGVLMLDAKERHFGDARAQLRRSCWSRARS